MENSLVDVEVASTQTSTEVVEAMIRALEVQFKTGPIIGEAREVIVHLCMNLALKDFIIFALGHKHEESLGMMIEAEKVMGEKDIRIAKKREEESEKLKGSGGFKPEIVGK